MASCHSERNGVFFKPRHKTLTKQLPACCVGWAFSEKFLRALFFCPAPRMREAPSDRGGFSCFRNTPIGKAPGVEYLDGRVRLANGYVYN